MFAVREIAPARIAVERGVVADPREQSAGLPVVEADAPERFLAEFHDDLTSFVDQRQFVGALDDMAGDARRRRLAQKRDVFGPKRNGEKVGDSHQVAQENLESAVPQPGVEDVALLLGRRPQLLVHLDVEQPLSGAGIGQDPLDVAEGGAVLEGVSEHGLDLVVEVVAVHAAHGIEAGVVDVGQPLRRVRRVLFAHPAYAAAAVYRAFGLDVERARGDGEGVFVWNVRNWVQGRLQSNRLLGDAAGLQELEDLEVHGHALERLQDQLDVSGRRDDGRPVHAVFGQPGEVGLGEAGLEAQVIARHLASDQRTVREEALPDEHLVVAHDVDRCPLLLGMPREEMDNGLRLRILGGEIQGDTRPEESSERLLEADAHVPIAHERWDARGNGCRALDALGNDRLQSTVRRDLQHHVCPVLPPDRVHRRPESYRCPNVGPPVRAVEPARRLAGYRGHQGHVAVKGAFVQEGEGLAYVVLERVHHAGVEGDVAGDQTVLQAAPVEFHHYGRQDIFAATNDGIGRRVLAGDLDPSRPGAVVSQGDPEIAEESLDALPIKPDGQHATGARDPLLLDRPVVHQVGRIGERQHSACVGGGHLAGAVAHHAIGVDAPRPEELHQGTLQHEDRWLRELDLVQLLLARGEAGFSQRKVRMLTPVPLDGVDHAAKDGIRSVESAAAPGPLRALARKHHGHAALTPVHGGDGLGILHESVQRGDKLRAVTHGKRRPRREMGAATAEVANDRMEIRFLAVDEVPQPLGAPREGTRVAGRQGNHEATLGSRRDRPYPWPGRLVFPHDAVSVRAAEAERIDPHDHRALREGFASGLHLHGAAVEVDLGIRDQVVLRDRSEGPPLHHQEDLEQRAVEGRGFHVSDIALDAGEAERDRAIVAAEGFADRVPLDPVAHHGARRVCLDVVELGGRAAGSRAGRAHQLHLRVSGWRSDVAARCQSHGTISRTCRVHGGGVDHGMDSVSIPLGGFQGL